MLLLIVSAIDVFSLNANLEYNQVPQVNQGVVNLFKTYDYNFSSQRSQDYYSNPRFATLASSILGGPLGGDSLPGGGTQPYSTIGKWGALYWNTESFVFFDAEASVFRTDSFMSPLYDFYQVWVPLSQEVPRHLGFPIPNSTTYKTLSGDNFPKLQLFSSINVLPTRSDVANILGNASFSGEMLFSSASDMPSVGINGPIIWKSATDLRYTNERLNQTAIKVDSFSFDTLRLTVNNILDHPAVLYYADAWWSSWHADVNGVQTPVIRTNLGYKSVIVPPGKSQVVLAFDNFLDSLILDSVTLLGIIVFCSVIYLFLTQLRRTDARSGGGVHEKI
jgi:hypothetical protein